MTMYYKMESFLFVFLKYFVYILSKQSLFTWIRENYKKMSIIHARPVADNVTL